MCGGRGRPLQTLAFRSVPFSLQEIVIMVGTDSNKAETLAWIRNVKRVEAISIRIDHARGLYVWTLQADGQELVIEGGREQLAGMLLSAQTLLSPELGAREELILLGQN
jgi:hypothetical protein